MQIAVIKKTSLVMLLFILQSSMLLIYLNANIVNVGEFGAALSLLAGYIIFSALLFLVLWLKQTLYFRVHFFIFLLLMAWVSIRVAIDLGDIQYLKKITIATTGGMFLFYFGGALLRVGNQRSVDCVHTFYVHKILLLLFFLLMIWMLYNFSQRIRPDLFYLNDINGTYQRSGNFLSISFIVISSFYLNLVLKLIVQGASALSGFFWLNIYTFSTLMALIGSQLFGSNSATAVILGVYLITLVMALIISRKKIWLSYLKSKLALPWSKRLLLHLTFKAIVGLGLFIGILALIISVTGFDITSLRLLGFGTGTNTSLFSRIDILIKTGANQIGYAPFLGNMNVAYLTTGNAGRTLHSFFPYVMANLGLVGLFIVLALFTSVLVQLFCECKLHNNFGLYDFQLNMIALYSIFILLYIIFFANLATGISWAVLWFTLGFVSKPFGFR